MRRLALSLPFLLVLATGAAAQGDAVAPKPADPPAKAGKATLRPALKAERAKAPAGAAAGAGVATGATPAGLPDPGAPPADPALAPATDPAVAAKPALGKRASKGQKAASAAVDPDVAAAAANEAAAKKAQQAADARNKAWDVKTKKLLTGICRGC